MRCDNLRHRLLLYAEGELDDASRRQVAAHLTTCERCRSAVESFQDLTRAIRALRNEAAMAPDELAFACAVHRRISASGRLGFDSLVAKVSLWVEDVANPLLEQPVQALAVSGLILWLAGASVASRFGLEGIIVRLAVSMFL